MLIGINTEIAFTYLISRKKQTTVAALGVTFGISMYIFMNALIAGTNEYFEKTTLSTMPHIRFYRAPRLSGASMLDDYFGDTTINLIVNPQLVTTDSRIQNPETIIRFLKKEVEIEAVSAQVNCNVIYSKGGIQSNGIASGVNIIEQDKMFDIASTLIAGRIEDLHSVSDGIIIGSGLSRDLNVFNGGTIVLSTSTGTSKTLRVVGIFRTTIKNIDNTKSYVNVPVVEQLLKKDRNYITDIFINLNDHTKASKLAQEIESNIAGYEAEDWQSANEQSLAARMIRDVIANSVVITILIVAGFGIYNILNMTIYEKIKEIAILKATGFAGAHIISIFIRQALFIGLVGGVLGLLLGWLISLSASSFYIGLGNVAYLPIAFKASHYIQAFVFGISTTFMAGYIPAIRASEVDPVKIIRG